MSEQMKEYLPTYTVEGITNGILVDAHTTCLSNCNTSKCKKFYDNILVTGVFITCPHGMSVYKTLDGTIYTCMREKTTYNKKLASQAGLIKSGGFSPVLEKEKLVSLMVAKESTGTISHEIKQLNAQIREHADLIWQSFGLDEEPREITKKEVVDLASHVRSIFVSSSMISSRYMLYDYEKDPKSLQGKRGIDGVIYKKFDKIKKIFYNYKKRRIPIEITGNSFARFTMYPSFEMIPLLIVENAIKYTYDKTSPVHISFEEKKDEHKLIVCVESYSPYCKKAELKEVFQKGFRGEEASKVADGSGIGLYFVKQICDIHGIDVLVESDGEHVTHISDKMYAPFRVILCFDDVVFE